MQFPLKEIIPPPFEMTEQWSLDHLFGYLSTWSALQTYIQKMGSNPLLGLANDLKTAWGEADERAVNWDLALRVGRKLSE